MPDADTTTATVSERILEAVTGPRSKISLTAAVAVVTSGLGTVTRYAIQVMLAQLLGAAGFGLYLTIRRWGETLAVLPNRGFQGASVRFLPDYVEQGDWPRYRGLIRKSLSQTLIGAIALAAAAAVVAFAVWEDQRLAAVLAMATIPAWAIMRMAHALLGAQHHFLAAAAIDQLTQPWVMAIGLVAVWALRGTVTITDAVVALLVSIVVAGLVGLRLMRRRVPAGVASSPTGPDTETVYDLARWRPVARHFMAHQLSAIIINSADLLILAMFRPRAEVGLYGAATRIAFLARVVNNGTDSIVAPRITAAWATRNLGSLQRNVDKAIAVTAPPTFLLVGLLILMNRPILGLMGEEFVEGAPIMMILLIGIAIQAFTGPCGNVVALTDNERFNARTMMTAAVTLVIGCLIVAPIGGMTGVAIVTATVNTMWNLVLTVFARRRLGIRTYPHPGMLTSLAVPDWARRSGSGR